MSETHIIAILTPAKGKSARLTELLDPMIRAVHEKEDYTLRYIQTIQQPAEGTSVSSTGEPDVIMIETYRDPASATKHTQEPHFKELFATLEKEGVLAGTPYLAQSKTKLGFDLDHKLQQA